MGGWFIFEYRWRIIEVAQMVPGSYVLFVVPLSLAREKFNLKKLFFVCMYYTKYRVLPAAR
eukprot:TRINITY_DN1485_c0_g2_i2.p2 TRINITY_DN1485_c0_g2~~TRINITY_DN1485_c0_g2_i2.p2  ORF type:complete len:61 (+),score=4.66 TRINITY_DN1485_c0_g2_i2:728-910(+)